MRVLFNGLALLGAKTGIGHYSAEVLRCVRAKLGAEQVFCYQPNSAFVKVGDWLKRPTRSGQPILWRQWALLALRCLRDLARPRVQVAARKADWGAYDLYHEPNIVPLPIDLPTVVTIHDLSVLSHPEWHPAARLTEYSEGFARGIRIAEQIVTVSESARQEIIRMLGVPAARVTVTYNGARAQFRPLPADAVRGRLKAMGLPPSYLLHVGTIEPRKNLVTLMKAYCDLPDGLRAACPLVLVGGWGWNCKEEQAYLHETARHKGVLHAGYLAEDDLATVFNGARALVFPTRYEGFGMPAVEMLACGGAVLASTADAVAEVLGGHGHLIGPDDVQGWRDAMRRVIEDDGWRGRLCAGGVERASRFTWERCADETLKAYEAALRNGAARKQEAA